MEKILPPVLETERLILRPITSDDKPEIFKWASDPEVTEFMLYTKYNSPDDADPWLSMLYQKETNIDYGFVIKATGELIGSGGIIYHPEDDEWVIGYNIRRDMWGKGLVPEVMKKIIEYARSRYEVKIITGTFAEQNPKSGRVMEKLGLTYKCDTEYTCFDGVRKFKAKKYELKF